MGSGTVVIRPSRAKLIGLLILFVLFTAAGVVTLWSAVVASDSVADMVVGLVFGGVLVGLFGIGGIRAAPRLVSRPTLGTAQDLQSIVDTLPQQGSSTPRPGQPGQRAASRPPGPFALAVNRSWATVPVIAASAAGGCARGAPAPPRPLEQVKVAAVTWQR